VIIGASSAAQLDSNIKALQSSQPLSDEVCVCVCVCACACVCVHVCVCVCATDAFAGARVSMRERQRARAREYRVVKMRRTQYFRRLFSAKEPYN